jgi:hypothetical protein
MGQITIAYIEINTKVITFMVIEEKTWSMGSGEVKV